MPEEKDSIQQGSGSAENDSENKFVPRDAYQAVTADMFKYKSEMKNLKAELEKMRADVQAKDEAKMREQGEYQKLADQYRQKYEEAEAARKAEQARVLNLHKLHALDKEVGGFQKSEYARVAANLENIKLDENGFIESESLKAEVQRIRQEHPALLKSVPKATLPNQAPGQQETLSLKEALKNCKTQQQIEEVRKRFNL